MNIPPVIGWQIGQATDGRENIAFDCPMCGREHNCFVSKEPPVKLLVPCVKGQAPATVCLTNYFVNTA